MNELKRHIDRATNHRDGSDDAIGFVEYIKSSGQGVVLSVRPIKNCLKSGDKQGVHFYCKQVIEFCKEAEAAVKELIQKFDSGKLKNIEKL